MVRFDLFEDELSQKMVSAVARADYLLQFQMHMQ